MRQDQANHEAAAAAMSERLAAASATAAAQQAAMQRLGREMEREAGRVSAAEHEMSQRTTQLRRVHEQLCSLHNAGSVVAAAGLSWAGLMEDMAQQVSAVGAALALSESRHAMAIEEAARMGADLTHLRHELRERPDCKVGRSPRPRLDELAHAVGELGLAALGLDARAQLGLELVIDADHARVDYS